MLGSSTKIAFILSSPQQLKLVAPIIDYASQQSQTNIYIYDFTKKNDQLCQDYAQQLGVTLTLVKSIEHLTELIKKSSIDWTITESIKLARIKKMVGGNLKLGYLQHSHDLVSTFPRFTNEEELLLFDKFFLFSEGWKEAFLQALAQRITSRQAAKVLSERIVPVGFPELDQLHAYKMEDVRNKYQKVKDLKGAVFFDPIGYVNHVGNAFYGYFFKLHGSLKNKICILARQLIYDLRHHPFTLPKILWMIFTIFFTVKPRVNYESLVTNLREYCDSKGLALIVKSRPKNNDPAFLKENVDLYEYDTSYYPFTLLELLSISTVYIGFNSSTTLEAVSCGCKALQLNVCPSEFQYFSYAGGIYEYLDSQLSSSLSWNNYPGVVDVFTCDSSFDDLMCGALRPVNVEKRKQYLKQFLYSLDGKSSERIINEIYPK